MGRFLFLLEHIWCRCFNLPVIHSDRYLCCTAVGNVFWGSTGFVLRFTAAEVKTLLLLLMLLAQENNSRRYRQYETAWKPILPLNIFENRTNCIVTTFNSRWRTFKLTQSHISNAQKMNKHYKVENFTSVVIITLLCLWSLLQVARKKVWKLQIFLVAR